MKTKKSVLSRLRRRWNRWLFALVVPVVQPVSEGAEGGLFLKSFLPVGQIGPSGAGWSPSVSCPPPPSC